MLCILKNVVNVMERKLFNILIDYELPNLKHLLVDRKMWDFANLNNIKVNFSNTYSQIKKTEEFDEIKKFTQDKHSQAFVFDILYPQIFQKILFGTKYTKMIRRKLYLPIADILFFIKISNNVDSTIAYFYSKIK